MIDPVLVVSARVSVASVIGTVMTFTHTEATGELLPH